jgi:glycosyltransferase involved in cell wall biosynthesis
MRIVHQVLGGEVAGGQLVALRLALAARAAGHEAEIVSPTAGPFVQQALAAGVRTEVLPLGQRARPAAVRILAAHLRRRRPSLLHTHGHFSANTVGRLAARAARVPVLAHMHIENHFRAGPPGQAQRALDNVTARLCARIVAVSESTRSALERQGYPAGRLTVVPNGIPIGPPLAPVPREELGVPTDARVIVEVARLCAVKGQRELIAAASALPGDAYVVLVGEDVETGGVFRLALEREAAELGIGPHVVFAGHRPDAQAVMASADIVALPSWTEGLPLVVLEAMAQARPVVATAVGGTGEAVVHDETGLLVRPRDTAALGRALSELLEDPERRRSMGQAGRRRVEALYDAETSALRVLALYEEVAS